LRQNVTTSRDRFTAKYSASTEVRTVLDQEADIDRFVKAQPAGLKGGSEWDAVAANLTRLAGAYGTTFPSPLHLGAYRG
jgi:hypothetical protein